MVVVVDSRLAQLIRRARVERGISQRDLATRTGISQAVVSYYENGHTRPSSGVLERLEHALGLPDGHLSAIESRKTRFPDQQGPGSAGLQRTWFLRTVEAVPWRAATVDRPAGLDGGDLAFAVDLRSHVFLTVVDAQGAGEVAASVGRVAAACAFGATVLPGGGVPLPEDIVEAIVRLWRLLGQSPDTASACVLSFERRTRRLRQCRLTMPPPFLRSGRLIQWTGRPDGPAGSFLDEQQIEPDALLVVATDGVADLPTKGASSLWNSPEFRTALRHVTSPQDVAEILERRLPDPRAGRTDDRLAVAVMP